MKSLKLSFTLLIANIVVVVCANGLKAETYGRSARHLADAIDRLQSDYGQSVRIGIWFGTADGQVVYTHRADEGRPTASAIKTSFLIELFARYHDSLDIVPSELNEILAEKHPAISHFSAAQQGEIRAGLSSVTVRQLGAIMMGARPASNLVYNAAANVTTALLGGPERLTKLIHARSTAFGNLHVRRYMLADRKATGDNTATPEALAAIWQQFASGKLADMTDSTLDAVGQAILTRNNRYKLAGRHVFKDGSLDSDPMTRVQAGSWLPVDARVPFIYVVMVEQNGASDDAGDDKGKALTQFTQTLTELVLSSVGNQAASTIGGKQLPAPESSAVRLPTDCLDPSAAMDGWLAIFDGQSTFGFQGAAIVHESSKAALHAGATTSEFADFEVRIEVAKAGTLQLPDRSVKLQPGNHTLISLGRRGPLRLNDGLVVTRLNLKPLGLVKLFNGKDFSNWERRGRVPTASRPGANWSISSGAMRVVGGPEALEYAPSNGPHLFSDFVLQLEACTKRDGTNGGLFIRNEPGRTMMGYEIQLHHPWYDPRAGKHGYTTGGIDDRQQARVAIAVDHVPFRMTVVANGPHLATWVSGYQTADWTDTRPAHANPRSGLRLEPGTIQIQAHDPETDLEIRQVLIQQY